MYIYKPINVCIVCLYGQATAAFRVRRHTRAIHRIDADMYIYMYMYMYMYKHSNVCIIYSYRQVTAALRVRWHTKAMRRIDIDMYIYIYIYICIYIYIYIYIYVYVYIYSHINVCIVCSYRQATAALRVRRHTRATRRISLILLTSGITLTPSLARYYQKTHIIRISICV